MIKILNLGCGVNPFKDTKDLAYMNMDTNKFKPKDGISYLRYNIMKFPYPIESNYFDRVYLFHTIEHIPEPSHKLLLNEIRRVLKDGGEFVVSYPEFIKVAKLYIDNVGCKREFWKKVIYGRGLTQWDFHKALMNTEDFLKILREVGLLPEKVQSEKTQSFNTVVVCKKGDPMLSYEKMLGDEFATST